MAGVYDIFANVINAKTHKELKRVVADQIDSTDAVLECCCYKEVTMANVHVV